MDDWKDETFLIGANNPISGGELLVSGRVVSSCLGYTGEAILHSYINGDYNKPLDIVRILINQITISIMERTFFPVAQLSNERNKP